MKFQTCFFAVYLSALISFLSLGKFQEEQAKRYWLVMAIIFAICSSLTMANGLIVWPLLVVQGFLLKIRWKVILSLALLGATSWLFYFQNYIRLEGLGDISDNESTSLIETLLFLFQFFGSPFHFQTADPGQVSVVPALAGAIFIVLVVLAAFHAAFYSKESRSTQLSLVAFMAFIGATGLAISISRSILGPDYAFVSRYTTPALLGWLSILVYFFSLPKTSKNGKAPSLALKWAPIAALLAVILLTYQQLSRVTERADHATEYDRRVAIIGLLAGIYEPTFAPSVYIPQFPWPHDAEALVETAREAQALKISIFNQSWLTLPEMTPTLRERMAKAESCTGAIETVKKMGGGVSRRVTGTVEAAKLATIILFDERIDQVGVGVVSDKPNYRLNEPHAPKSQAWVAFLQLGEKQRVWEENAKRLRAAGKTENLSANKRLRAFVKRTDSLCEIPDLRKKVKRVRVAESAKPAA